MRKIIFLILFVWLLPSSCEKHERFSSEHDDIPPGKITVKDYKPLFGGARFFYTLPDDEDLLGIEATYTNGEGKDFTFMASYFDDSLDVYGFPDENEHTVKLYAVDRSGNRSEAVEF